MVVTAATTKVGGDRALAQIHVVSDQVRAVAMRTVVAAECADDRRSE